MYQRRSTDARCLLKELKLLAAEREKMEGENARISSGVWAAQLQDQAANLTCRRELAHTNHTDVCGGTAIPVYHRANGQAKVLTHPSLM